MCATFFQMGHDAYYAGKNLTDNPCVIHPNNSNHKNWNDGYMFALNLEERKHDDKLRRERPEWYGNKPTDEQITIAIQQR